MQEIKSALRTGEAYFKLTEIRGRDYAILITPQDTTIYRVAAPAKALGQLAARVRNSIDGRLGQGRLDPFNVGAAYTLYRLIAGPAAGRLEQISSLIVDPSGPIERLPIGVLVTDQASVGKHKAASARNKFDFSSVSFLAGRTELSTAVSPRSFLIARALPPSRANKPFIGFAEHQVPAILNATPAMVDVNNLCHVDRRHSGGLPPEQNRSRQQKYGWPRVR